MDLQLWNTYRMARSHWLLDAICAALFFRFCCGVFKFWASAYFSLSPPPPFPNSRCSNLIDSFTYAGTNHRPQNYHPCIIRRHLTPSILELEEGTDKLSRKVSKQLPTLLCNIAEELNFKQKVSSEFCANCYCLYLNREQNMALISKNWSVYHKGPICTQILYIQFAQPEVT